MISALEIPTTQTQVPPEQTPDPTIYPEPDPEPVAPQPEPEPVADEPDPEPTGLPPERDPDAHLSEHGSLVYCTIWLAASTKLTATRSGCG